MIAFWILLILTAFHFALAAPLAIEGEMLEVRFNEDAPKGRIAAWEKHTNTDEVIWMGRQTNRTGIISINRGAISSRMISQAVIVRRDRNCRVIRNRWSRTLGTPMT
jgi:hypothetical protein